MHLENAQDELWDMKRYFLFRYIFNWIFSEFMYVQQDICVLNLIYLSIQVSVIPEQQ